MLQDVGRLVVGVDVSMFDCSCIESCAQNRITFSVQVCKREFSIGHRN